MNYAEGLNGGLSQIEHSKKSPFYNIFFDIMESVIGTRCLIKPCSMNGAIASKCISVDTMLQNLCDFSPTWRKNPWGKVGLSIENVCSLSVVIYKTKEGSYRLGCNCYNNDLYNSEHGDFQSLREAMRSITYSIVAHRILKPFACHTVPDPMVKNDQQLE